MRTEVRRLLRTFIATATCCAGLQAFDTRVAWSQESPVEIGARYHVTIPRSASQEIKVDAWILVRDGDFFMDSIQAQQLSRGWATLRQASLSD